MGGHGGLNILPQKSWNGKSASLTDHVLLETLRGRAVRSNVLLRAVYGRENRLKVARDEAKHREEEDKKREKHMQVSSSGVGGELQVTQRLRL